MFLAMEQVIWKDDTLLRYRGGICEQLIHVRYPGFKKPQKVSEGREVIL